MQLKPTALIALLALGEISFGQDEAGRNAEREVEFYAEEITLAVTESTAAVGGVYFFRNNSDRSSTFPVMFPFHIDSMSLYPEYCRAYIAENGDTTALEIRKHPKQGAITLRIPLKPNETTTWQLEYRQKILGQMAKYIITSTQAWGKPLEEGVYRFIVPTDFDSVTVWPEADSVRQLGNFIEYVSHKIYFMPDKEMMIRWK